VTRTLHVVALPHTTLTEKDAQCAYSMKLLKAVPMWRAQGCRVILYGPDEIDCEPDEHVVITTEADRLRWGYGGPKGYDTTAPFEWDAGQPYWFEANVRAIDALRERLPADRREHYLCLATSVQAKIADEVAGPKWNNPITVEWGVGYIGIDKRGWSAFESYAWMHHVYGIRDIGDGRAFDQVIPNFFDASQFSVTRKPRCDYVLFIGRIIKRKGPDVAAEIAKRIGVKLLVAGPGAKEVTKGRIVGADDVVIEGDVEHVGSVGFAERNELMSNAAATIVPTVYIEPFGGVAVEAMLAGCPVVASDWGSFTEIVTPDVGARFRTPKQGAEAFARVQSLKRKDIRQAAKDRYSQAAVGPMFMRWFDQLDTLWGKGWYE
jgi:glycosyltransferase involved in cell wall biosynthesis